MGEELTATDLTTVADNGGTGILTEVLSAVNLTVVGNLGDGIQAADVGLVEATILQNQGIGINCSGNVAILRGQICDNGGGDIVAGGSLNLINPEEVVFGEECPTEDVDGDGFAAEDDCDDSNPAVHPGATEFCNNVDDNCDGVVGDSPTGAGQACNTGQFGVCSASSTACLGGALSCVQNVQSSAELCDGLDNDCDGQTDEGLTVDGDGDGHSTPGSCGGTKNDCNDTVAAIHPGAAEVCGDGIDQDCNGQDVDCITLAISMTDTLIADVQGLNVDQGTKNSLLAKLNSAKSSLQKGNTQAAEGQLNAFINEVSAQKGKKIPVADADRLIAEAQAIIAIIP